MSPAQEIAENPEKNQGDYKPVADILFAYLRDAIYKPSKASLDLESLPESFQDFGKGMLYYNHIIGETMAFAKELAKGNLDCVTPARNELASPLKMMHAALRHLTWQTQQVANGDYKQRVNFMGDFSAAFNNMIQQLEERQKIILDEKSRLELYVELILKSCPNPILLFDSEGKLVYASDSSFHHWKTFSSNESLGKPLEDLFAPIIGKKSLDEIMRLYKKAGADKQMFETEQKIDLDESHKSSSYFKIQLAPMMDKDEQQAGIIMFFVNITESIYARREAERARKIAEQATLSKSNFLTRMSHEIRTPMNAIMGMAELALRENIPPVAEEYVRTITQAGSNLLSIINDILDFSKIEAGKLEIIPTEYTFASLIIDVLNIIRMKIAESGLQFVVNIDSGIPNMMLGDPIRLRQILLNLLSNAAKYTPEGHVAFSVSVLSRDDEYVTLKMEVADTGRGIKESDLPLLFNDFVRFDLKRNTSIEGTGLGLAITKTLAKAMNGSIDVHSVYGEGSTFSLTIPQKIIDGGKMTAVENPESKKVLVYDRRELYRNSIAKTLENLNVNYRIVSSAPDFFAGLKDTTYSFVFFAADLYEDFRKEYPVDKPPINCAMLVEFNKTIIDRDINILTLPLFSVPIANFLNGNFDGDTGNLKTETFVKFTAPGAKVMVVDDIFVNLQVADGLLQPYQMQVILCNSGKEAIEKIKTDHYDLVLMDYMMPEMDGVETVAHIREMGKEDPYYKNVPIVALTADAVSGTREMILNSGFDGFLSKPIDTFKLNATLEKCLPQEKQNKLGKDELQNADDQNADVKIEIAGLSAEKGIRMAGGSTDRYLKILSLFCKDGYEKINAIKTSLETGDMHLYIIHVHALKSASANIGADKVSEAARTLEMAGKQEDLAFIQSRNAAFIADFQTLLDNINTYLSGKTENAQNNPLDKIVLINELGKLKKALNDFDFTLMSEAENVLQEFTEAPDIGAALNEILQKKLTGEYDEAVLLIDTLLENLN